MKIQSMFQKDINRDINGVVKVAQDDEKSLHQELSEYIITKELRRHFRTFFDNYTKAIDQPTDKMGVWISGFFGSGKSHFLKMLSYLLSNKEVQRVPAIDYFKDKFDDPIVVKSFWAEGADAFKALFRSVFTKDAHDTPHQPHSPSKQETPIYEIMDAVEYLDTKIISSDAVDNATGLNQTRMAPGGPGGRQNEATVGIEGLDTGKDDGVPEFIRAATRRAEEAVVQKKLEDESRLQDPAVRFFSGDDDVQFSEDIIECSAACPVQTRDTDRRPGDPPVKRKKH